ncbi:MAG: zinc-binding dehydrogenase [Candidatus Marinimicrobia bacterium]|nr:zinc-binding dehydrogenase [Candidatus Neomarinimicrobiota bacterium]
MNALQIIDQGKPLEQRELRQPVVMQDEVLVSIKAAGICHSDAHYRAGTIPISNLPITPGHEIAGVIEEIGGNVKSLKVGDHVSLNYLLTCGKCEHCSDSREQFCPSVEMLGKNRDGGYAEFISVPERNAVLLPEDLPFHHGAILMCSWATSFHALNKSGLTAGMTIAVFGVGGLGIAAVQLSNLLGAADIYAVDINKEKLKIASKLGATALEAAEPNPAEVIRQLTEGSGVDIALEFTGIPEVGRQAIESLGVKGIAAFVGVGNKPLSVNIYDDLINKEAELIGVSDHLPHEIEQLLNYVREGKLDLSSAVTRKISLDVDEVNRVLDEFDHYRGNDLRTVIVS